MRSKSLTGIAGAHFVAAELCQRGYIATLTSRNTEGIDILASSSDGAKQVSIQVKTSGDPRTLRWVVGQKEEKTSFDNLFYVFVKLKESNEKPDYYIVPSADVAKRIKERHQKWLQTPGKNGKSHNDNPVRNFALQNAQSAAQYLDNWKSLGI